MKKSIVSVACLAVSGIAFAAAPMQPMSTTKLGWYVGAGLNYTGITANRFELDTNVHNSIYLKQDHAQIGINLLGGNRLSKHFGTEAGYSYIGNSRYKDHDDINDWNARVETINNYNLYWVGIGYIPLNQGVHQFEVLADGGIAFMHVKNQYNYRVQSEGDNSSNALSSFAFKYGVGAQYNYKQFSVRGTYEHVQPSTYQNNMMIIPDTVNLDVMYMFA